MGNSRDGGGVGECGLQRVFLLHRPLVRASHPHSSLCTATERQPLLKHVRAVKWNYQTNIFADYIVGDSVGVVFSQSSIISCIGTM